MNRLLTAVCFCLLVSAAAVAPAQDSEWRLGGRAIILAGGATSQELGDTGSRFKLGSGAGLEFDAIVMFSEKFGAEFTVGASVQNLDVVGDETCCGDLDGGRVWLFPLTAMGQFHIPVYGEWDPYVGLGIAWAIPYYKLSQDLESNGVERVDFEGNAGLAVQVGVNYALDNRWYANIDLRYLGVTLDARVRTEEGDLEPVTLNTRPLVIGFGMGYRY